jgi:ubiquitin-like protein Pup
MAEREQRQRVESDRSTEETEGTEVSAGLASRRESSDRLKNELDDLLDEIDEVLETNAEEFVKSYIQKGGE